MGAAWRPSTGVVAGLLAALTLRSRDCWLYAALSKTARSHHTARTSIGGSSVQLSLLTQPQPELPLSSLLVSETAQRLLEARIWSCVSGLKKTVPGNRDHGCWTAFFAGQ